MQYCGHFVYATVMPIRNIISRYVLILRRTPNFSSDNVISVLKGIIINYIVCKGSSLDLQYCLRHCSLSISGDAQVSNEEGDDQIQLLITQP